MGYQLADHSNILYMSSCVVGNCCPDIVVQGEKCSGGGIGMSLPDVVLDASMAMSRGADDKDQAMSRGAEGKDRTSTDSGMDSGGLRSTLTPSTPSTPSPVSDN